MPVAEGHAPALARRPRVGVDGRVEGEVNGRVCAAGGRVQPLLRRRDDGRRVGERGVDRQGAADAAQEAVVDEPRLERHARRVHRRLIDGRRRGVAGAGVVAVPVRRRLQGRVVPEPRVLEVAREDAAS